MPRPLPVIHRWRKLSAAARALTLRLGVTVLILLLLNLIFGGQPIWMLLALTDLAPALILLWFWKTGKG